MSAHTVSISPSTQAALSELARHTGQSEQTVLDQAIEEYRRKVFFDSLNAGYGAWRADPTAWAEELAERKEMDATLMDGLDADEHWTDDGRALPSGHQGQ
jgi:predicted transcriptional regulator